MDKYNLKRFIAAQTLYYEIALQEISSGRKKSHWMWYIFPQLEGLGTSYMSKTYAISTGKEAKAYMENPYLRDNLIRITKALLSLEENDPLLVMGFPDNEKLCSCMTLFELVSPDVPEFGMVLEKYYCGRRDSRTLKLLEQNNEKV